MKIVVDTNVILDFFLSREPHVANARTLFEMIYQDKIDAFTTASSITDIYYIVAKKLGENAARETVRQLLIMLGIIAVDGNDCAKALDLPIPDFEDALITVCADKEDIDYIVSNDRVFLQLEQPFTTVVGTQELLGLV